MLRPLMSLLVMATATCVAACGSSVLRVSTRGFATGMKNHSLARTAAENRALDQLSQLLEPAAVKLEVTATSYGTLVTSSAVNKPNKMWQGEYQPLEDGWMAIASAERQPEAADAMLALPAAEIMGEAKATSLGAAALLAHARALRGLARKTLGDAAVGHFAGTATLVDLQYEFAEEERQGPDGVLLSPWQKVVVRLKGLADLTQTAPVTPEDEVGVLRRVSIEHSHAAQWPEVEADTELLATRTPDSIPFLLLRVGALRLQGKDDAAKEALEGAVKAAGDDADTKLANGIEEVRKAVNAETANVIAAAVEERAKAMAEAAATVESTPTPEPKTTDGMPTVEESTPNSADGESVPVNKKGKKKKKAKKK